MYRAYKYRIYPTPAQIELINKTFGCVRFVYNYMLDFEQKRYENKEKFLGYFKMCTQLKTLKGEHDWLYEVPHRALVGSLLTLDDAYKRFFKTKRCTSKKEEKN